MNKCIPDNILGCYNVNDTPGNVAKHRYRKYKNLTDDEFTQELFNNQGGVLFKMILYTNNCPKCKILKSKLDEKNIIYEICDDVNIMMSKGFRSVPMLEVDGQIMTYLEAINFLKETNH